MSNLNTLASTALWYKQLKASTNDAFFDLYANKNRYLVLMGGGGSGKSIFAGRKTIERLVSEENHRFLVLRKVARTIRESCFTQICGQLGEYYNISNFKINRSDMVITYKLNGSQIIFAGLDDVEKLKSIYNITGIWIEEASEISESDFNQLDIRLRGETKYYKQIILSFNPIDINHWLKKRFFDNQLNKKTFTHKSTYLDNRFLDDESKEVLTAFKDTDPYYYQVYCLGEWGVYSKSIFDKNAILKRLSEIEPPVSSGMFTNGEFIEEDDGYIEIYEQPKENTPYVIGADTAGEGSDFFAAHVINNITGKQVAVLHGLFDEDVFARQLYDLGRYYNMALIGVEANFSTYPIRELERLGYKNQYIRERVDNMTHKKVKSYGFKTTALTRPVIISDLVKIIREKPEWISDRKTLEELQTFVRNEKGRPEAAEGSHDDLVLSLAITYFIRDQQSYQEFTKPVKKKTYKFDVNRPEKNIYGTGEDYYVI